MTERKMLKKELAKLKSYRKNLPRLIDCSDIYGDKFFTEEQYREVDKQIADIESKIAVIDSENEYVKFMEEYHINHEVCPKCGDNICRTTIMGFAFDRTKPEEYKDLNRCNCLGCGDWHTRHDRVNAKLFNKKK